VIKFQFLIHVIPYNPRFIHPSHFFKTFPGFLKLFSLILFAPHPFPPPSPLSPIPELTYDLNHPPLSPPPLGVRASSRKRNNSLKAKKLAPVFAENDRKRSIRLTAYMALAKVREAEKRAAENGEVAQVDEETRAAAKHGAELEHCDQQKRDLRDKGHFFFVNPSLKKAEDAFPVVSNPDGVVKEYDGTMAESDKNIKMSRLDRIAVALARGKKYKKTNRSKHAKF
jgi:hypothetical protein